MESFSTLPGFYVQNSSVRGEIPSQGPVTRSFDVSFDMRMNKRLSKQTRGWWFEPPSRSSWRHCDGKPQVQDIQGPEVYCKRKRPHGPVREDKKKTV